MVRFQFSTNHLGSLEDRPKEGKPEQTSLPVVVGEKLQSVVQQHFCLIFFSSPRPFFPLAILTFYSMSSKEKIPTSGDDEDDDDEDKTDAELLL